MNLLHRLWYHSLLNADYQQQKQKELWKKSHILSHKPIIEWGSKLLKEKEGHVALFVTLSGLYSEDCQIEMFQSSSNYL